MHPNFLYKVGSWSYYQITHLGTFYTEERLLLGVVLREESKIFRALITTFCSTLFWAMPQIQHLPEEGCGLSTFGLLLQNKVISLVLPRDSAGTSFSVPHLPACSTVRNE